MELKDRVLLIINQIVENPEITVTMETPLLGDDGVLNSMSIVELCLNLEDLAIDLGSEFDWTSDSALSRSRSVFRTVGTLTADFERQMSATS